MMDTQAKQKQRSTSNVTQHMLFGVIFQMARKNEYLERCAVECANILPHYKVLEVGFAHGLGLQYAAEKSKSMKYMWVK